MSPLSKLDAIEDAAVDVLGTVGPWLGPIPSAYLVGRAAIAHLNWHPAIAWIAAVAVESIGVVSVVLSLRLWEWNQTRRKADPAAPFGLAVALVAVYFVVTIGLTVLLDVVPQLARYAPAVFPLLAAVGAVNIAIKNGQRRREAAIRQERTARQERRKGQERIRREPRQDAARPARTNSHIPADWRLLTDAQRQELAGMSSGEIRRIVPDLSPRAARGWASRLSANGYHQEE